MNKLAVLLALAGIAAPALGAPFSAEEGIEVDYDALIDAEAGEDGESSATSLWHLIKRATGADGAGAYFNKIPKKMFPFVVSINVDLPKATAISEYSSFSLSASEQTNLFMNYDDYSKPYCAGAVIHQNWILTAGRCMDSIMTNTWTDYVTIFANRKHMRPVKNENWINFTIANGASDIYLHPFYNPVTFENDLALIRVQPYTPRGQLIKKLHAKRYKFPIITDESDTFASQAEMTTGGWGLIDSEVVDTLYGRFLDKFFMTRIAPSYREITLLDEDASTCDSRNGVYINSSITCSGIKTGFNGALCVYDEGAPLFVKGEWRSGRSSWNSKLVSIYSQYIDSDTPAPNYTCQPTGNYRAVATKVAAHCSWLRQVTDSAINCFGTV